MKHIKIALFILLSLFLTLINSTFPTLSAVALAKGKALSPKPYTLTIAHINDTHAHIEPTQMALNIDNVKTTINAGGLARVVAKIKALRKQYPELLFLHGGDLFQGTLYFKMFNGFADKYFMEEAGLDAMVLGNHEFDKGPENLTDFILKANFDILSANLNAKKEPSLDNLVKPYTIKVINGEKVAIIGLTTADTSNISNPGKNISFLDPIKTAQNIVNKLTKNNINKIIVLSHLGLDADKDLAQKTTGIDVIIGAHSHSLMGDYAKYGLEPRAPYPLIVNNLNKEPVLIAQAWKYGMIVGLLNLQFNKQGKIIDYETDQNLIFEPIDKTKVISKDHNLLETINKDVSTQVKETFFAQKLIKLKESIIGHSLDNLIRKNNQGPGPLITDAFLWKVKKLQAQVAIDNADGVRSDLNKGPISIADIYSVLPFEGSLIVLELTGKELKQVLLENAKRQFLQNQSVPFYISGLTAKIDKTNLDNINIFDISIQTESGEYYPLDLNKTYRLVTNNYLADGGSENTTLKNAKGKRIDTGFIETQAFIDYIKHIKELKNITEKRIVILE